MTRAVLIVATIVDLGLAALLIGVSGFIFGSGPESMHGGAWLAAAYAGAVITCVAVPFIGFAFNRRGKIAAAIGIAWLPALGALVAAMMPAPY